MSGSQCVPPGWVNLNMPPTNRGSSARSSPAGRGATRRLQWHMPRHDSRSNPVGTSAPAALAAADRALWRAMSFFDTPLADLDAAAAEDPAWPLPPVMKACFLLSLTEAAHLPEARALLGAAGTLAAQPQTPERERAHLAAAHACAAGDWAAACAQWGAIAQVHPQDGWALQWAHLFDFHRGDAQALQQRPAAALPAWAAGDPLRPYVQALHAFGLEECGDYAAAEAAGRAACAGSARVPWATHAVAHVLEMQGRFDEGRAWLVQQRPAWAEGNGFANHHWWHLALFHLEALDTAAALALYDDRLGSAHCFATLQRLDGAALLWRLQLLGADVAARWGDMAEGWDLIPAAAGWSPFNDLHALLVLMGTQRWAEAEAWVAAPPQRDAAHAATLRAPLLRGLLAAGQQRWAEALALLLPLLPALPAIGGSHAQRDIVTQTVLAAAAHSHLADAGLQVLLQREATRRGRADSPLTAHWRTVLGRCR